jgi:phosphoglycerate dehydrogenase-like enzyme
MKRDPAKRRDDGFTAWPETGHPAGEIPASWFGPAQLHEMLPLCDVLVITTPATPATLGMIGRNELALMRKSSILVNVARGGIVDEPALANSIRTGQLAGAVVDCFSKEPAPPDHVFFDTPGLVLTPHVAGVSRDFWPVMAMLVNENVQRIAAGRPVLNPVDARHRY